MTRLRDRVLCCVAALLLLCASAASSDDTEVRQPIPGTRITLTVPGGYEIAHDFPGIGRAEDFASVLVTELDVPAAIAADSVSKAALERNGLELVSSTSVQVDGRPATKVEAVQKIGAISFRKWFLVFGNETRSVLLTATTPAETQDQHRDVLVHVLETAHWAENGAPAGATAELGFQVKEVPPLKIVRSAPTALVLSEAEPVKGHVTPVVTVGQSQAQVAIGELANFAKTRLEETPSIGKIEIRSQSAHKLGALPGHEIRADALDTESGRAVKVLQLLAGDGGRYYLVQGIFDAEDARRLEPAFEGVAASFALRTANASAGDGSKAPRP